MRGRQFLRPRVLLASLVGPLLLLGGSSSPSLEGAAPAVPDKARLARLIEQLGSDSFAEREEAEKGLQKLGLPALGALRTALVKNTDPEVRRRALRLVQMIEREEVSI